jgi:hypothetical protein
MGIMGIGDWGLGDWGLGPIPNPQSPIPINFIFEITFEQINSNLICLIIYF